MRLRTYNHWRQPSPVTVRTRERRRRAPEALPSVTASHHRGSERTTPPSRYPASAIDIRSGRLDLCSQIPTENPPFQLIERGLRPCPPATPPPLAAGAAGVSSCESVV